jgi:hypothetical protein
MSRSTKLCSFALLILIPAGFAFGARQAKAHKENAHMKLIRSTPIQVVDAIEPNLDFWEKKLGFTRTGEVPPGAPQLDFVMLEKDGLEVMLQTRKSIAADIPSGASMDDFKHNVTIMYMEVDSLEEAMRGLEGTPIVMKPVDRPYGMREMIVKDPSGYFVSFAQKIK